jgi:hypothetical protein
METVLYYCRFATWLMFSSLGVSCLPAAAQDITSGMLGHWRLQETSGNTAIDATSTVQNGTYTNGVLLASSACSKYRSHLRDI